MNSAPTEVMHILTSTYLAISYAKAFNRADLFPDDPSLYEHIYSAITYNRGIKDESHIVTKIEVWKFDRVNDTIYLSHSIKLM